MTKNEFKLFQPMSQAGLQFITKIYMDNTDQRNSPFNAIFTSTPAENLLSLNALKEAVGPEQNLSSMKFEDSEFSSRVTLVMGTAQPPSVMDIPADESPTFRQLTPPNEVIEQSVRQLEKEESLHYIYKEEHSSFSKENVDQLLKMEESSIQIKEEQSMEEPKFINMTVKRLTVFKDQRQRIEQDKVKIQQEKNELDRKRLQIHILLKEYQILKEISSRDSIKNQTKPKAQRTHSTAVRKKQKYSQNRKESYSDDWTLGNLMQQKKTQHKQNTQQSNKQKIKQKKVRQALHLQTLLLNILKNQNQTKIVKRQLKRDFFERLIKISCVSRAIEDLGNILDAGNTLHQGFAFRKIKQTQKVFRVLKVQKKQSNQVQTAKKNVFLKVSKKQSRQAASKNTYQRVCQTEASRFQKLQQLNLTQLHSTSQAMTSLDFDRLTYHSNGTGGTGVCEATTTSTRPILGDNKSIINIKTTQIDAIIKNQLIRAKQQKALRQLSNETDQPRQSFLKSSLCSGNLTSRASNIKQASGYQTQRRPESITKVALDVFAAVAVPSHSSHKTQQYSSNCSRQSFSRANNKKITLWRK